MIADAKQVAPERPFFMYFCPGANHAPHHTPKEWADKYKGKFDMGYEKIREEILARQKAMGLVPQNDRAVADQPARWRRRASTASHRPRSTWSGRGTPCPRTRRSCSSGMAEVYAGYSQLHRRRDRPAHRLPRGDRASSTTRIIVIMADNGASGEGGPNGSVNENKFFNSVPDDMAENLKLLDVLGLAGDLQPLPDRLGVRVQHARSRCSSGTPGRAASPTRWSSTGPRASRPRASCATSTPTAIDVVPTVYECLGVELPEEVKGYTQWPLEGTSFRYSFDDAKAKTQKASQFYQMLGTRALWRDGWKVDAIHRRRAVGLGPLRRGQVGAVSHATSTARRSTTWATSTRSCVDELVALWHYQAGQYFGLPLEDRTAVEVLTTPRPQMSPPRDRYIYYPGTLEVPEAVAVNVRGRSYKIAAEVDIATPERQRRALRPRPHVRRARAVHQGRQAQVRLQLPRRERADDHLRRWTSRRANACSASSSSRRSADHVRGDDRHAHTSTSTTRRSAS